MSRLDFTIQSFVTEIPNLERITVLGAVEVALGGDASPWPGSGARRGPGRSEGSRNKPKAIPARPARGGQRARRSSEAVDATAAKFLAFVKATDGKRIEELAQGLKLPTSAPELSAQKLPAAKAVRTTRAKRGTAYPVGKGSMPKPAAAKKT